MSTNAYADWGAEAYDAFVPGEDLTSYVGHAVYVVSDELFPLSDTDQATTQSTYGAGVLLEGAPEDPGAQCRVVTAGRVRAIAGTGGVTAGDTVAPLYAASGATRGRFIQRSTAEFADGDFEWGTAMTTAAAGGEFLLELRRRRVQLDGAP
jgi:hypothetical protein